MNEPLIALTDLPELKADVRCPKCNGTQRQRSTTFGPVHDVCSSCGHNFKELTVPEHAEDEGADGW